MIIRILFYTIFIIVSSHSITLASSYETGKGFYDKKEFDDAAYFFRKSCNEERCPYGCLWLALCYRQGAGVPKDIDKALSILRDSYNKYNDGMFLYGIAHTLEYFTYDMSNYKQSFEIYKHLSLGKDVFAKDSREALHRFYIMEAVNELFSSKFDFAKDKINLDSFKSKVKYIDLKNTPNDFNVTFSEFSSLLLKSAEANDSAIMDAALLVGQSFLKGLAGDITFIGDAIGHGYKAYNLSSDLEEAYKKLYEILDKYKISSAWWKALNAKYSSK